MATQRTDMKKKIKIWLMYPAVGLAAFFILLGLLVLSALVSKESVRENFKESASFLSEGEDFLFMEEGVRSSCIHIYADSITLNIAYGYDLDAPLESVMWSKYSEGKNDAKDDFYSAVYEDAEANYQYLRYWHGSAGVVKFLHLFLNIKQIYILNGCIFILLTALLLYKLVKKGFKAEAVVYVLSLIAVSIWYVPFALEYTWCFLIMAATALITVSMALKERYTHMGLVFLLCGIITIYLDFLTTETITLIVPLMLVLVIRRRQNRIDQGKAFFKKEVIFATKNSALWLGGYVFMWIAKWVTASIVLGENVMPYVTEHIEERLSGEITNASGLGYAFFSVWRNLKQIFPVDHGLTGGIILGVLIVVICYLGFVYHRKKIEWSTIILLSLYGLVPIVRFMVLRNHSTHHYFFTFRALVASVLAILLSVTQIIDLNLILKKKNK